VTNFQALLWLEELKLK